MKIRVNEFLFSVAYYPWILFWMFTSTYLKDTLHPYGLLNIWEYLGVLCIILKFGLQKTINAKSLLLVPITILVAFFVSKDNGNASFVFYSFLLIVAASDLEFDRIVKWTMILQILSMSITVLLSLVNIIPNELFVSFAGGFLRNRYGLGYIFPTFAPNFFFSIVIEYIYFRFSKIKWIEYLFIAGLNIFFYQMTGTRVTFILVFAMLLLEYFFRNRLKLIVNSVPYSYVSMAALTYLLTELYNPGNSLFSKLNLILSQRLRFAQQGLQTWGISLFGTSIQWNSEAASYNYVDFSYINILISYGLIVFIIVIAGYTITGTLCKRENNIALAMVLWIWAIRASVDPQLFLLWFNPFLLLIGRGLFSKRKVENDFNSLYVQRQNSIGR